MKLNDNWLSDMSIVPILQNLGEYLEVLDLSENPNLGENSYKVLAEVIESKPHVPLKQVILKAN